MNPKIFREKFDVKLLHNIQASMWNHRNSEVTRKVKVESCLLSRKCLCSLWECCSFIAISNISSQIPFQCKKGKLNIEVNNKGGIGNNGACWWGARLNSSISALYLLNIRILGGISSSNNSKTWMVILVLCTYSILGF